MSLLQASVINKYLKTLDKQVLQAAYTRFKAHFHNATTQENIRNSKEEQYQEGFLNDLFVNVLGYVKNPTPNYNLTTEYKNVKDSKKADGAIVIGNRVKAVIELKGTNTTDLGNVEVQAFGYKNNQPECDYIITSNFEKLRFYIDNAIEHMEFNLFTLSEKEFELFYLCLAYQSIEKDIPKKLKEESISQEDKITKQLYNDYSLFKRELYQNLVALNPEYDALVLFKKSQKLLDRYLFLFFAEDRQLLPPNSVRMILNQWQALRDLDEYNPLYNRFKKYFGYLNTGFKGKQYDVFAYNGGLFKPDAVLDNVKIDDDLLYKHTVKLSEYDFVSEVDVNILGHIFENSLNELDEVKAQLAGVEVDKTKTRRKKDGVFYTPKYITKYIVDNTVGKLCTDKRTELGIVEEDYFSDKKRSNKTKLPLAQKLTAYRDWLLQITICDPACGSGAFLNQALNFLIDEHRTIDEMQAKLFGDSLVLSDIENTILENNLFGVDLNEESVEIAKLSLWLRTARPNRKLNDLSNNIKCGNSLIEDPTVAGDKAFNWELEFPHVFTPGKEQTLIVKSEKNETPDYLKLIKEKSLEAQTKAEQAIALSKEAAEMSKKVYEYAEKLEAVSEADTPYGIRKGGFDVVIGNPPYFNIQTLGIGSKDAQCIQRSYPEIWQDKSDILFYFIYKALKISKSEVGFIVSNAFLFSEKASKLRNLILEDDRLSKIINFEQYMVFEDASITSCITLFSKQKEETKALIFKEKSYSIDEINSTLVDLTNEYVVKLEKNKVFALVKNDIARLNEKIDSLHPILQDVAYLGKGMETAADGIFLFDEFPTQFPKEFVKKRTTGLNIDRYEIKANSTYILYFEQIDEFEDLPESIQNHLIVNRETLQNRATVKNEGRVWWRYSRPMHKEYYNLPKLYCSRRAFNNTFCYDEGFDYLGFSNMTVIFETNKEMSVKYIMALINSKLLNFRYKSIGKQTGGGSFEYFPNGVGKLPIPKLSITDQQPFIAKADLMLSLNKELQEVSGKFQRTIMRKFNLEELPGKLQNWYLLTYSDFIAELGKKKIKLSLNEEAEWESYFVQEAGKALAIKNQLETTDRKIDQLVYALYGLTEEEISIVETK
ncbi:MAG: Eco57I restriction-modification methylase domain-containing protein [Paludibacter sp.]